MAAIIVAQQVSTASATAIFGRLQARVVPLEAAEIEKATEEDLRACGLSNAKIRALRAVAQAIAEDGLDLAGLGALDAEDAHNALVAVKGVGPWTADVFLLFCLGHPDAFPAGDVALQEAAKLALNLKRRPDAQRLERIAERWRPLRGVAARMLWAYYRGVKARSGMALGEPSR
jgi:DNA-3-methyladenine glycosylase II